MASKTHERPSVKKKRDRGCMMRLPPLVPRSSRRARKGPWRLRALRAIFIIDEKEPPMRGGSLTCFVRCCAALQARVPNVLLGAGGVWRPPYDKRQESADDRDAKNDPVDVRLAQQRKRRHRIERIKPVARGRQD